MKPRTVIFRIESTNDIPIKKLKKKAWLKLQYFHCSGFDQWINLKIDHISAQVIKSKK